MLLILAAISLSAVFSDKGVFSRAENAGAKYNEAKAREVLETVLLADGQYEKNINPEYNQDRFLDELIKSEIPGSKVIEDVAIVDGYGYELDRSVPKIGRYIGKEEELIFPTVTATAQLTEDKKNAIINITAIEEKNGINKIEIWINGEKIAEYPYDNVKTEITVNPPYIATQNGEYTIKAYGDLMASTTVEVTGIMPGIEFEPNGNTTWEKEHSTKIKLQETEEKIKTMKYQWSNSVTEPADNTFTENCKNGDTITKNNVTGTYYLWILLETESGATAKRRSERFNFDNEGPTITAFTATKYSETGITLSATAQDIKSGAVKFEFYVDDVLKGTETCTATTSSVTKTVNITGLSTGSHSCKVIVYDAKNNKSTKTASGTTKLYTWTKWSISSTFVYELDKNAGTRTTTNMSLMSRGTPWGSYSFNKNNGRFSVSGYLTSMADGGDVGTIWTMGGCSCTRGHSYIEIVTCKSSAHWIGSNYGYCIELKKYSSKSTRTDKKGTTQYSDVTSTSSSAYPSNGASGSYWYVYKGVY